MIISSLVHCLIILHVNVNIFFIWLTAVTALLCFKSDLVLQLPLLKIVSLEKNSTFQNTAFIFKVVWQIHYLWFSTDEICSNMLQLKVCVPSRW